MEIFKAIAGGGIEPLVTTKLTGRRRYQRIPHPYYGGVVAGSDSWPLALEVEETRLTVVSGVEGWETSWRFAKTEDITDLEVR